MKSKHLDDKHESMVISRGTKISQTTREKIENEMTYSFDPDYDEQEPKQLVLFSTVEARYNPPQHVISHMQMYSFFQKQFNFTAIMFSKSPSIAKLCEKYGIIHVDYYKSNHYKIPYIRDMYMRAYHLIKSRFYGYVNSDIILSHELFSFLDEVEDRLQKNEIPENVGLQFCVHSS